MNDPVNHPKHYNSHPSGVEAIEVTEHYSFCHGNAIKYLWRAGLKGDALQDLQKASWYVDREICRLQKLSEKERAAEAREVQERWKEDALHKILWDLTKS